MGQLAPSILSFNLNDLSEAIPTMVRAGAACIHFDVMDGQFVPPITFGDHFVSCLRPVTEAVFEVHLMTLTPEKHFESFVAAGANRIIFHAEATSHAHRLIQVLKGLGVQSGIAINPGTPASAVLPVIGDVDEVLVMTVNPGWGGQKLIGSTLEKIREIRSARHDVLIEVDGGVDPTTLPLVRDAGANVFVVGSYLAKQANLEAATEDMARRCA